MTDNERAMAHVHFDRLLFEHLSDAQLITLIELSGQELDRRYPFETLQRFKCPACGQTDNDFWIGCRFVATLTANGAYVPMDTDDQPRWGADSGCRCPSCDYSGHVIEFVIQGKEVDHGRQQPV